MLKLFHIGSYTERKGLMDSRPQLRCHLLNFPWPRIIYPGLFSQKKSRNLLNLFLQSTAEYYLQQSQKAKRRVGFMQAVDAANVYRGREDVITASELGPLQISLCKWAEDVYVLELELSKKVQVYGNKSNYIFIHKDLSFCTHHISNLMAEDVYVLIFEDKIFFWPSVLGVVGK